MENATQFPNFINSIIENGTLILNDTLNLPIVNFTDAPTNSSEQIISANITQEPLISKNSTFFKVVESVLNSTKDFITSSNFDSNNNSISTSTLNSTDVKSTTFGPSLEKISTMTSYMENKSENYFFDTTTMKNVLDRNLTNFQNNNENFSYFLGDLEIVGAEDFKIEEMSPGVMSLILVPLMLITITIILGNLLVVFAVFTQRSLRSPQNIYIVSLSLVDMMVAVFVLPFNMTHLVLRKWPFGPNLCKMYLMLDVSLCCVSIFHLCAIGIDRYRAITDGMNYARSRNLKSVILTIGSLWILALWIGSPPLLAVNDWKIICDNNECAMPSSPGYAFHLAIGALFFPLIIMSIIYFKIYTAIKEWLREKARVNCMELTSEDTTDKLDDGGFVSEDLSSVCSTNGKNSTLKRGGGRRKASAQISTFLVNKQKYSLSKERKAARTLGIIMGAFILCWLPLGFLNTIGSLCPPGYEPPEWIFVFFTWLGYANSALNPIIYATSNQEFQKAFRRILHLPR